MAKLKIKTHHNYKPGSGRQTIEEPSKTQPGHTRTIKEIMDRYRQTGELPEAKKNAEYFDVEDLDHMNEFFRSGKDLTDLQRLSENVQEMHDSVESALKAKKKAEAEEAAKKKKEEEKAKLREEIEAEKKKKKEDE